MLLTLLIDALLLNYFQWIRIDIHFVNFFLQINYIFLFNWNFFNCRWRRILPFTERFFINHNGVLVFNHNGVLVFNHNRVLVFDHNRISLFFFSLPPLYTDLQLQRRQKLFEAQNSFKFIIDLLKELILFSRIRNLVEIAIILFQFFKELHYLMLNLLINCIHQIAFLHNLLNLWILINFLHYLHKGTQANNLCLTHFSILPFFKWLVYFLLGKFYFFHYTPLH